MAALRVPFFALVLLASGSAGSSGPVVATSLASPTPAKAPWRPWRRLFGKKQSGVRGVAPAVPEEEIEAEAEEAPAWEPWRPLRSFFQTKQSGPVTPWKKQALRKDAAPAEPAPPAAEDEGSAARPSYSLLQKALRKTDAAAAVPAAAEYEGDLTRPSLMQRVLGATSSRQEAPPQPAVESAAEATVFIQRKVTLKRGRSWKEDEGVECDDAGCHPLKKKKHDEL